MHANARLTYWARRQIAVRHLAGWTQRAIADQLGASTATISKWWRRFCADPDGHWWFDRTSRHVAHRPDTAGARGRDRGVATRAQARAGSYRLAVGDGALDGAPGACARRVQSPRLDGPSERTGGAAHPHQPARRARQHRHQEALAGARRWWLAGHRPRCRPARPGSTQPRDRLRALCDRPLQLDRPQRSARR